MRQPMLPPVRTLVDCVPHRPGIDRSRQQWIDRERRHSARTEARETLPSPTPIARFIHRIVRRDVKDIRVRRMQRNRDDRLAVLLAASRTESDEQKGQDKQQEVTGPQHSGGRPNHSGQMGVKQEDGTSPLAK